MIRESVEITLDKPRRLRYDLNALVALERVFGVSALGLFDRLFGVSAEDRALIAKGKMEDKAFAQRIKVEDLRTLLWAGLLHEEPDLTPEAVGKLIDFEMLPEIVTRCMEALNSSFKSENPPETQKKELGAKQPRRRIPRRIS